MHKRDALDVTGWVRAAATAWGACWPGGVTGATVVRQRAAGAGARAAAHSSTAASPGAMRGSAARVRQLRWGAAQRHRADAAAGGARAARELPVPPRQAAPQRASMSSERAACTSIVETVSQACREMHCCRC